MITQPSSKSNATLITLRKLKKTPSQLWRGYTALATRNLPFTAVQFPLFEHLRSTIQSYRKRRGNFSRTLLETGTVTAISAGFAGLVAAVITTPIDVIKTRIMLGASSGLEESKGEQLTRAQQAVRAGRAGGYVVGKEIFRTEGIKGLFRGGALRALWTAAGSGLYLSAYESGRKYLEVSRVGGAGHDGQGIS